MICKEKGVLPGSEYFFFTPSIIVNKYFYYLHVCGHFYCESGYYIKRRDHFSPLLIYVIGGLLHVEINDTHYLANESDIVLIDCRYPHCYFSDSFTNFIFFHFDGVNSLDLTEYIIEKNGSPILQSKSGKSIYNIMNNLITKHYNEQPVPDYESSCAIHEVLCHVLATDDEIETNNPFLVSAIIGYIRKNISSSISLNELSRFVNLSPFHFSRLFKKATNCSPMEYVSRYKINIAKTILKTTTNSINEIADYLGYSSSASFINAFIRKVGLPPNKYRNFPL